MSEVVGIVNYKTAGNTHSVRKALERAGATVLLLNKPSDFSLVSKVILPGVGSFKEGMRGLEEIDCLQSIRDCEKPILGICLGMQILGSVGYEHGLTLGLGLIDAEIKQIQCLDKVPHMGFNKIKVAKKSMLFSGIENENFYFMHSFEVVNYTDILSLTNYSGHTFVSSVEKNNIFGVQFHPEKSRDAGIKLFQNFLSIK